METILPDPVGNYLETHGTISSTQFVHCGDILTSKYPSWTWESGVSDSQWSFLPKDKQYLIKRNVQSNRIINKQEYKQHIVDEIQDDDWTITTHTNTFNSHKILEEKPKQKELVSDSDDLDYNIEIDDNDILKLEDKHIYTRTYDIYITYDKYYQTPRIWLFGYNYDNMPLSFNEMKDDIESDYINRTVTYEKHPHIPLMLISIHPCKHSNVMKKLMKQNKKIDLDNYIFIFLKFISSIIPNINYDHTTD
jgi:ubiquitin-like-conjugating enzyme ATG3